LHSAVEGEAPLALRAVFFRVSPASSTTDPYVHAQFRTSSSRIILTVAALLAAAALLAPPLYAWGPQGHRLVAMLAANYLTPVARENVAWLLGDSTLAEVSTWADEHVADNRQTFSWHFVNIPPFARSYERDRDCPLQPGVARGAAADTWRDCIVDRILYSQERLADKTLDHADRALALKFLVHFIADLHQPFHALGLERGGEGVPVIVFGRTECSANGDPYPSCNLHRVWDVKLIARRNLSDLQYLTVLHQMIRQRSMESMRVGTPDEWAMESQALARHALLPAFGKVDDAYYRTQIDVVDERLASAGVRLAAFMNRALTTPPPRERQ
jgi:hypothetical protein